MNNQGTITSQEPGFLTGFFRDRESTEKAYRLLRDHGYSDDEINIMMSEETRNKNWRERNTDQDLGSKALAGTGIGGAIGGTIGAIIGGTAAIGTNLAIPGIGLVVAGPIAAALAGAGAGGLTGGLIGALIGWGIPEDRAELYEKGICEGGTVLGVRPRSHDDAELIEREWHAEHVYR